MKKVNISLLVLCFLFMSACHSKEASQNPVYCGYELSDQEYEQLTEKIKLQKSAYDADPNGQIYDQLNDSIRSVMPDSIIFEVFMTLLNKDEVALMVIVPDNKEYFERIGCKMMNTKFSAEMPEQRYLFLYTYTEPDGGGVSPVKKAIKRKK